MNNNSEDATHFKFL